MVEGHTEWYFKSHYYSLVNSPIHTISRYVLISAIKLLKTHLEKSSGQGRRTGKVYMIFLYLMLKSFDQDLGMLWEVESIIQLDAV